MLGLTGMLSQAATTDMWIRLLHSCVSVSFSRAVMVLIGVNAANGSVDVYSQVCAVLVVGRILLYPRECGKVLQGCGTVVRQAANLKANHRAQHVAFECVHARDYLSVIDGFISMLQTALPDTPLAWCRNISIGLIPYEYLQLVLSTQRRCRVMFPVCLVLRVIARAGLRGAASAQPLDGAELLWLHQNSQEA